jgi:hypothetical protein
MADEAVMNKIHKRKKIPRVKNYEKKLSAKKLFLFSTGFVNTEIVNLELRISLQISNKNSKWRKHFLMGLKKDYSVEYRAC